MYNGQLDDQNLNGKKNQNTHLKKSTQCECNHQHGDEINKTDDTFHVGPRHLCIQVSHSKRVIKKRYQFIFSNADNRKKCDGQSEQNTQKIKGHQGSSIHPLARHPKFVDLKSSEIG